MNRFLEYITINTQSDETYCGTGPSTACQFDLANYLRKQMIEIGMEDVHVDENCYCYGFIGATSGFEDVECIGLIAHLDTSPDFSGSNVRPQIIENYDGCDVPLGTSGLTLSTEAFPHLKSLKGRTLITTDGTTLLGADDKAGIAVILDACERIISDNIPHGRIAVCFTPDEEIGGGADLLDLKKFGAGFAITIDGGAEDDLNFETFNAAAAHWDISGVSVHPGTAKGVMINALLVAMKINDLLPHDEIPSKTDGYEGFFHLINMRGDVSHATLDYIIRDHSTDVFRKRKELMKSIENKISAIYGPDVASVTITDTYYNMRDILNNKMEIVNLIRSSMLSEKITPAVTPVRGGTDGSRLSFRGLPCPNIGTGGYAFHGPYEHITLEGMEAATKIIMRIIINLASSKYLTEK